MEQQQTLILDMSELHEVIFNHLNNIKKYNYVNGYRNFQIIILTFLTSFICKYSTELLIVLIVVFISKYSCQQ